MNSTTQINVTVITATLLILVAEAGYLSRDISNLRAAPIAVFAQIFLCALRALTLLVELLIPGINCALLGNIGIAVYALWICCLDGLLLLRARTFLQFSVSSKWQKIYTYWCCFQILISGVSEIYIAATAFNLPFIMPYCIILANFFPANYVCLANRCLLYALYAYPFIAKAISAYKDKNSSNLNDTDIWLRLSINNGVFTLTIILIELLAAVIGSIPDLVPWLKLFFSLINFVESNILLLIVDDTKKNIKRNAQTLWICCLDGLLLLRARTFLQFSVSSKWQKIYTYWCCFQILISGVSEIYIAATAFNLPFIMPYCIILANFFPANYVCLANRCLLYALYAYPFIAKAISAYKDKNSSNLNDTDIWLRLSINNGVFTLTIILIELLAAVIGNIPGLVPWLKLFFSLINFVESNILLLIVDDTKKNINKNQNSNAKQTKSSNSQHARKASELD
ncbi:hypothetical protein HDV01_007922 [Terramyces sp. JEL0728]|nr:hypothetical protein HDV01_007922 [Terramyces sp. JEL0728]